jgi:hypothetical protein
VKQRPQWQQRQQKQWATATLTSPRAPLVD